MRRIEVRPDSTADTLRWIHRLHADVEAEIEQPPGSAPVDFPTFAAAVQSPPYGATVDHLVARDERGELIGAASLTVRDDDALRGVGKFHIEVPARLRRRGIGSALLEALRERSKSYDIHTLYSWAPICGAGLGFLANVLQRQRGEEIWSVLDLRRSVPEVVGSVAVELRHWVGACPADLLNPFAAAHRAVGAAARGSEAGSERVSAELLHTLEAGMEGQDWLTVAACEPQTRSIVGFSQIDLPHHPSRVAHQQFTGVAPGWRRRGVARLLKTRSAELVRDGYPDVAYVITENAADNVAIRTLNVSMGFRVYRHYVSWEEQVAL